MSTLLKSILFCLIGLVGMSFLLWFAFPVAPLRFVNPGVTSFMMQSRDGIDRRWVPLSAIASSLQRYVVKAEDGNFYTHHGIDFDEFRSSWKKNVAKRRYARGFSTLTMQLARNLYLSPQKALIRKLMEILIALKIEQVLPKTRILELYLNVVEWAPGVYGAEAASQYYFHSAANKLSAEQAAFLAAILPSPKRWGHWPPGAYVHRRMERLMGAGKMPEETLPPDESPEWEHGEPVPETL